MTYEELRRLCERADREPEPEPDPEQVQALVDDLTEILKGREKPTIN